MSTATEDPEPPQDAAYPGDPPAHGKGNFSRRIGIGLLAGIALYAAIVFWSGSDRLLEVLEHFPWWTVPAACALSFSNYALRFLKWERYRTLLGIELSRGLSFEIYLAGFSMGVTPGKMGEVLKSWLLRRATGVPIHRTAPIVIAERFTDLLGYLILMAVGGLASAPEYVWIFWSTLGLCVLALALAGSRRFARLAVRSVAKLPYFWRVSDRVGGALETTRMLLAPKEIVFPTLLSAVSWGLECLGFHLIANGIATEPIPFLFSVFAYALSAVGGAVMILFPGGLGITEGLLGTLLRRRLQPGLEASMSVDAALELARTQAAGATILARLCTLWFGVGIGFIALARIKRRYGKMELPS